MEPFVSIVIPVYKIKEEYLRTCFESLLSQDMDGFQVIAVDDGSPDNCGAICDEYAAKDKRITVIHQKNSGVSVARNNGIKATNTEWITFVDPDDWVEANHISTLYQAQQNTNADVILFDYIQEFAGRKITKHLMENSCMLDDEWVHNYRLALFNYLRVNGKPVVYETNVLWNKMYRTKILKNNNLWFEPEARRGQDLIFNAECFQITNCFYYVRAALYHYRYIQESVTNRFNPKIQYYNEIAFQCHERIIKEYNLQKEYQEAYYARVVTRMYSCMNLYYFHPDNKMGRKEVYQELDKTLNKYPYNVAIKKVDWSLLSFTQKVFVFFLKQRQYIVLRGLIKGRLLLRAVKGEKLSK